MPPEDAAAPARRESLPRAFRLKKRGLIQRLFDRGGQTRSVAAGSIRLLYTYVSREAAGSVAPLQVAFLLARGTRPTVLRNHLKRIMRESFRVRRQQLVGSLGRPPHVLLLGVLYRGSDPQSASALRSDLDRAFDRLVEREGGAAERQSRTGDGEDVTAERRSGAIEREGGAVERQSRTGDGEGGTVEGGAVDDASSSSTAGNLPQP